ncbi:MAG: hypothetical protein LC663_03320 [Actinobacteria bacterium]|nr:hypothetical protein [Actinomycetota bacterium]
MTTKRASLPGADELFRSTTLPKPEHQTRAVPQPAETASMETHRQVSPSIQRQVSSPIQRQVDKTTKHHPPRQGSGRQRHEEKITFYCTSDELLALERARLSLRELGSGADRGRIVREAVSYMLADLDANGAASILAERLTGRR